MDHRSEGTCLICGTEDPIAFLEIRGVPIHCNLLWRERAEALAVPRADIILARCAWCGHIFNIGFDPVLMEYAGDYENSLQFSSEFQEYAQSLAARLVAQYSLQGKTIVEIGSGRGDFLRLLCGLGHNRGIGIDPSATAKAEDDGTGAGVTLIRDFYSERYSNLTADFVCCRHTLEHVADPLALISAVRRNVDGRGELGVFFEVPNGAYILGNLAVWDIIYEHCSYFTPESLAFLFASCGFAIREVGAAFGDQFLYVEAAPHRGATKSPGDHRPGLGERRKGVQAFARAYHRKVGQWQKSLQQMARAGRRVVVWGAGSKGVMFLNTLRVLDQIEYVVDISPHKHGMYVAGTGQRIVPPGFLRDYRPDETIVMNPIYLDEIRQAQTALGVDSHLVCA